MALMERFTSLFSVGKYSQCSSLNKGTSDKGDNLYSKLLKLVWTETPADKLLKLVWTEAPGDKLLKLVWTETPGDKLLKLVWTETPGDKLLKLDYVGSQLAPN
jgi:hypothetical protein